MLPSFITSYITHVKYASVFDDLFYLELDDSAYYLRSNLLAYRIMSFDLYWVYVVSGPSPLIWVADIWKTADWDWEYMVQVEKPNNNKEPIRWPDLWPCFNQADKAHSTHRNGFKLLNHTSVTSRSSWFSE